MTDVCLVLEGTYPFVAGGVSTWIHQLVTAMKDVRFSILYISPYRNPRREFKYDMPPNIVDIEDLYLHDYALDDRLTPLPRRRRAFQRLGELHESLMNGSWHLLRELMPLLRDPDQRLSMKDVFRSEESWELLQRFCARYARGVSFTDFFWTCRAIYLPLVNALKVRLPPARLYHTVSTGYAGLVASMAKIEQNKSMLLTEHGVYTHERMLEISQANWIYAPQQSRFRISRELPFFKRFWVGFFNILGGISYHHADKILTLFEGNRTKEILAGADPAKIRIIPNGIDLDRFRSLSRPARAGGKRRVAFIGRVVSIKDVKNFIQAAKIVCGQRDDTEFLIMGPKDEEPEYMEECSQMLDTLGLRDKVRFLGKVKVLDYLPSVDVVVLTSLSEAQPYVIIEANAAGVPVVATDVGACQEMLEGRSAEDRRKGPSGIVTNVSNPEQTAEGVLRLLSSGRLWERMSKAGRERSFQYYDEKDLISQYLNLYEQNMR